MKPLTEDFLIHVIRPAVEALGFDDENPEPAETLLLGTALAESGLRNLTQIGGPALGFFQCEPDTHKDIWQNWICHRPEIVGKLEITCAMRIIHPRHGIIPPAETLIWNLRYSAAICRIHYRRQPGEIPETIEGMAEYWLKFYNAGGKGSIEHFMEAWENG